MASPKSPPRSPNIQLHDNEFLVACTRLYKSLRWSVGPSVPLVQKRAESVQKGCFSAGGIINVTAPAEKHATDAAVYTALLTTDSDVHKSINFLLKYNSVKLYAMLYLTQIYTRYKTLNLAC